MKIWECFDCEYLELGGCECEVKTGWAEKLTACPMDKTESCHWRLKEEKE